MSVSLKNECPFCNLLDSRIVDANELAVAIRDAFPVSEGHTLVIPRRHVESLFDLSPDEVSAVMALLHRAKPDLDESHHAAGYNVGINIGRDAGQTVMHMHLHLIPRYCGDVADPTGGVRNVIPGKGKYSSTISRSE